MRIIILLLVAASLTLGSGGVVLRSHADDSTPAEATPDEQGTCRALPPPQTYVHQSRGSLLERSPSAVELNSRGYNYPNPGEYRGIIPSVNSTPPAAVTKPE